MPRLLLATSKPVPWSPSEAEGGDLPPQKTLQDLLFQLQDGDFQNPHFQLARTRLRGGHYMRAIQDCSIPFNFNAGVSNSGRYIKFDVRSEYLRRQSLWLTRVARTSLSAFCASQQRCLPRSWSKTIRVTLVLLTLT
jgi:hypothetical protein